MWFHHHFSGFQTSKNSTIFGARDRMGKPSVLPFLLLPILYEKKLIYNQSTISQFWLMYHIAPISMDHQCKGQRYWEGLTGLQWPRPGNTFNSITWVNSKVYSWIPEWQPSVCLTLEHKKKKKNTHSRKRESGHLNKYMWLQRSWYSLQHLQPAGEVCSDISIKSEIHWI